MAAKSLAIAAFTASGEDVNLAYPEEARGLCSKKHGPFFLGKGYQNVIQSQSSHP